MKRPSRGVVASLVVGTFLGFGAAAGATPTPEPQVVKERVEVPGPTQTVEVPGPTQMVEIEVPGPTQTIEVTPVVCIEALDLAGKGFEIASRSIQAIQDEDIGALTRATRDLEEISDRYIEARDECYEGAGFDL